MEAFVENSMCLRHTRNKDETLRDFILHILVLYKELWVFEEEKKYANKKVIISYKIKHNIFYNRIGIANFKTWRLVCKPGGWKEKYTCGEYIINKENILHSLWDTSKIILW